MCLKYVIIGVWLCVVCVRLYIFLVLRCHSHVNMSRNTINPIYNIIYRLGLGLMAAQNKNKHKKEERKKEAIEGWRKERQN